MCFFFQAEDGIRDVAVTGVQTCALPIWGRRATPALLPLVRHGTPTASRIRAITRSASMSSASASKVSSTRCRNTSKAIAFTSSGDRKSTRLNSSHGYISYAVFCLKKKKKNKIKDRIQDED